MTLKWCLENDIDVSFNPCFGGSYIMTVDGSEESQKLAEFQSLFWWILYYD